MTKIHKCNDFFRIKKVSLVYEITVRKNFLAYYPLGTLIFLLSFFEKIFLLPFYLLGVVLEGYSTIVNIDDE